MKRFAMLVVCALAVPVPTASAGWSAPRLISELGGQQALGSTTIQGAGSTDPDVSADGRFVVFATTTRNLVDIAAPAPGVFVRGGVIRKDLVTGALELVAPGSLLREETPFRVESDGATRPAISANGRYVAFQTEAALAAQDTNGVSDVYVRDMSVPAGAPAAYELISARDGSTAAATYDGDLSRLGATTTRPGAFLSDDGDVVLFLSAPRSDLAGPAVTPEGQLFLRRRSTRQTVPVNVRRTGALGGVAGEPAGGAVISRGPLPGAPAVLSADGTTVVWLNGVSTVDEQLAPLPGIVSGDALLWRRVLPVGSGPTREVAGPQDRDDPQCDVNAPAANAACLGPLAGADAGTPLLAGPLTVSADGASVAFVTSWFTRDQPESQRFSAQEDLMVVDMRPGLSRKRALRPLTRAEPGVGGAYNDVALTSDGRQLFFTATAFAQRLERPSLIGIPPADILRQQLYVADLEQDTIEVVSRGVDGASPDELGTGRWTPSIAADGQRIVFSTRARNLIPVDGNQIADVFAIDGVAGDPVLPFTQVVPAASPAQPQIPERRLRVTATTLKSGSVRLTVVAPGRGALGVRALRTRRARGRAALLATASRAVGAAKVLRITLTPDRKVRKSLPVRGLASRVTVRFLPVGARSALTRTIEATFKRPKGAQR